MKSAAVDVYKLRALQQRTLSHLPLSKLTPSTGVDLYLHQQGNTTTTPAGKALFGMMGVFAEFERGMIQERVKSGLARAKKHGTKSGKFIGRPATSPENEANIREFRAQGMGMLKIAKQLQCGVSLVQRGAAEMPHE